MRLLVSIYLHFINCATLDETVMPDNKQPFPLTDAQIEELVERVTEKVIQNVYIGIGESVVKKFFWVVGLGSVALVTWLAGTGKLQ